MAKTARKGARKNGRSVTRSARRNGRSNGAQGRDTTSVPVLPYTTRPAALRTFLSEVPKRPKPSKISKKLLESWDIRGGDAVTIVRVLRALGLVNANSEPTDHYTAFMDPGTGPAVLAERIRETYASLFNAAREPYKESQERLRNLFNIHSGGAEGTIGYQIQTFKALCEYANFDAAAPKVGAPGNGAAPSTRTGTPSGSFSGGGISSGGGLTVHIDLHIHLPENKSSREYQYIIQDIARFIYGRSEGESDGERS